MAFKVKTTAPKLYCVRPNASIINPGESLPVSVILQGFSQPLPADYKCKDKFLLVSLPAPELTDPATVGEKWSLLEAKYKSQLVSKKLRVNYRIGADNQQQDEILEEKERLSPNNVNRTFDETVSTPNQSFAAREASPVRSSVPVVTPKPAQPAQEVPQPVQPQPQQQPAQQAPQQIPQRVQPIATSTGPTSPVAPSSAAQASPELQRELDALAEQVRSLSYKLDQNEKYAGGKRGGQQVAVEEPVNGISLPMALVLVLIAFLLGWLVF